jgi:hypothetical protein
VFISGAYSHIRTASCDDLESSNLLDKPLATRRSSKTNITTNPPRQDNHTTAGQPITNTDLETIQKGDRRLQLQLEQAMAKIKQNVQKNKTSLKEFPDHP